MNLFTKYFVEYQCKITDETDVWMAIHRWWKFDEENRTKYLQELLSSCVSHEEANKDCLIQELESRAPCIAKNDQYMSYVSLMSSEDEAHEFPACTL